MNELCEELYLDGLMQIDVFRVKDLGILLPPSVPALTQLVLAPDLSGVKPLFSLSMVSEVMSLNGAAFADVALLVDGNEVKATLKTTKSLNSMGAVYSYDLQVSGMNGLESHIQEAMQAESGMQDNEASVVLRFQNGAVRLLYLLHNTFTFAVEQNFSGSDTLSTLKITGQSLSNLIKL